jgi:hypothetical protein
MLLRVRVRVRVRVLVRVRVRVRVRVSEVKTREGQDKTTQIRTQHKGARQAKIKQNNATHEETRTRTRQHNTTQHMT